MNDGMTIRSSVLSSNDTYNIGQDQRSQTSSFVGTANSDELRSAGALSKPSGSTQSRPFHASKFKYYNAIKTGFAQTSNVAPTDEGLTDLDDLTRSEINIPMTHVVDDECFVFPLPLMLREPGEKSNSYVMIFSIWNTMIGTIVVSLPWAFQQAGLLLSICICFSSYVVSFYTCKLIVDVT